MIRLLATLLVLVAMAGAVVLLDGIDDGRALPQPSCADDVIDLVSAPTDPRVVRVVAVDCAKRTVSGGGSGWVAPDRRIVSARHVTEDPELGEVWIRTTEGAQRAQPVVVHGLYDLVLLQVAEPDELTPLLSMAIEPPSGAPATALGHVHRRQPTQTIELRHVGPARNAADVVVDQYAGEAQLGFSGGPVLDDHGRVVGTVYAKPQGGGTVLAVPIRVTDSLLRHVPSDADQQ